MAGEASMVAVCVKVVAAPQLTRPRRSREEDLG